MAAILLIVAVAFGCSSTNGSKSTTATKSQTGEWPSGSIHFEEWQFMAMLAGNKGHGTLGYNGKTYKFKVTGMGAGGYGVDKLSATGEVYRLKDIADFPGNYSELRGGIVLGKGIGGLYIRNDKGVAIKLKTHAEGVALSIGVQGLTIQMVEK
ncbi:MAG: hypothetical protein PVH58_07410 [Desulfobacterales bacterium]|jgi:hypothetical protein